MLTRICQPGIERCLGTTKDIVGAGCFALFLLAVASALAANVAYADEPEPEICRRAKALGYDESKELLKFSSKRELCTMRFWNLFQPKPLAQIFNEDEHKQYDEAIRQGHCKQATEILSKHFDMAHPGAPPHQSNRSDSLSWRVSMSRHYYDSLGLCHLLRHLRLALEDIDAAGLKPRPFWSWRENYFGAETKFPSPVREMYSAVASLLRDMGRTQSPKVALAVLKLSNEGRALKLHPHYEIYIARRLRELGVSDPLIDEIVSRPLDPETIRSIAEKVKRKDPSGIPKFPEYETNRNP